MTTPGFLAVPFVVRRAGVITTMPSRLARYFSEDLRACDQPGTGRTAAFFHLAAMAWKLHPGSGPSLAPPDCRFTLSAEDSLEL